MTSSCNETQCSMRHRSALDLSHSSCVIAPRTRRIRLAAHSTSASRPANIARFVVNLPAYVWLLVCGLLMCLIYYVAFTSRYGLGVYGDKPYQSVATLSKFSADGAFLYVGGFIALFALYWFGMR